MKILFTHELFLPDAAGGGEFATYEIVKRLKQRGHDILVLTTGNPRIKEYKGIKTDRLAINRYSMNFMFNCVYKRAKNSDLIQTNNANACFPSWAVAKYL